MIQFLFSSLLVLLLLSPASARHLTYSVFVSGAEVGQLNALCQYPNDSTRVISLVTKLSFPFREVVSDIRVRYHHNRLVFASSEKLINNKLKEWVTISWQNNRYRVDSDAASGKVIPSPIHFSVGLLYHFEPTNRSTIFSERLGTYVTIKSVGQGAYEVKQPNGSVNTFRYLNGVCTEMETEMMASRVKFRLQEP